MTKPSLHRPSPQHEVTFRPRQIVSDTHGNYYQVLHDEGGATVHVESVATKDTFHAPRAELTLDPTRSPR